MSDPDVQSGFVLMDTTKQFSHSESLTLLFSRVVRSSFCLTALVLSQSSNCFLQSQFDLLPTYSKWYDAHQEPTQSTVLISGIVAVVFSLIAIILLIIFLVFRRREKNSNWDDSPETETEVENGFDLTRESDSHLEIDDMFSDPDESGLSMRHLTFVSQHQPNDNSFCFIEFGDDTDWGVFSGNE
jgi:hypothetical protein